ncbi:hypothetical protein HPB49_014502 [Dermacentor silvarum]|uniref:Uncharacterized protein n=1 Tax=Dermacentor silvarum TaxID=543639 RepID=A0ACB8DDM7_DERSI|nr:hypothetical protein HPB49_014502 [Dermacentor silvarum]
MAVGEPVISVSHHQTSSMNNVEVTPSVRRLLLDLLREGGNESNASVENNISGNSPTEVPYEDELDKIRWLDDSLEPEVVRDASGVVSRKTHPQSPASQSIYLGTSSPASSASSTTETAAGSLEQEQQPGDDGRKNRPSTARMLQMTAFLEKVEEIEERRAKRKAERDNKKEERRLEKMQRREQMHAEKMSLLREAFGLDQND